MKGSNLREVFYKVLIISVLAYSILGVLKWIIYHLV